MLSLEDFRAIYKRSVILNKDNIDELKYLAALDLRKFFAETPGNNPKSCSQTLVE